MVKRDELAARTLADLRDLARSRGLKGVAKLRKADLVDRLLEAETAARPRRAQTRRTSRAKSAAKRTTGTAAGKGAKPRKRTAAPARKGAKAPSRAKAPGRKRRVAKRASGEGQETRGLSPRTRRAFSVYRPLAEHRVKASKYYLGVPESPELDEGFTYPETYGENAITLMVRDPYWLFTYWEFAPELRAELVGRIGEEALLASRLVLRVYDVTGVDPDDANEYRDIDIAPAARNWYINVMRVEREYCVDVGLITPDGKFVVIARSNRVTLPPVGPSDVIGRVV
jgi:hypothetical protein